MSTRRLLLPALFASATLLVLVVRFFWTAPEAARRAEGPRPTYPDFTVETASGSLALSDLRPRAVVVYFGYTACPDVCPTTLARVGAAVRSLPDPLEERVTALFISVDPERDTPETVGAYARYFHPGFRAGTLPPPDLAEVARAWGVFYARNEGGTAMGYTMDHSSQAFLVSPSGEVVEHIGHGAPPSAIVEALRDALL